MKINITSERDGAPGLFNKSVEHRDVEEETKIVDDFESKIFDLCAPGGAVSEAAFSSYLAEMYSNFPNAETSSVKNKACHQPGKHVNYPLVCE